MKGKVKWWNDYKGYGFVLSGSGEEMFVHHSSIKNEGFNSLIEGEDVTFDVDRANGVPHAKNLFHLHQNEANKEHSGRRPDMEEASPTERHGRLSEQTVSLETKQCNAMLEAIQKVRLGADITPHEAKAKLMAVIEPLLKADGYDLGPPPDEKNAHLDFVAVREASGDYERHTIGCEFKLYDADQSVDVYAERLPGHVLANRILYAIDRAVLFINTCFTPVVRHALGRLSVDVELIDLDALASWVARSDVGNDALAAEVYLIVREVSGTFARLIAEDPRVLDHLEWRDLERTVAEVFRGLGFLVNLTPSAKDGGKDIVLECLVYGSRATYIVEIKHWRSGSRVGGGVLRDFLSVVLREKRDGGLFLSTYGYCDNAFAQLTEIDRQKLRFGQQDKVVALCRSYIRARSGIWSPPHNLTEVLYDGTLI